MFFGLCHQQFLVSTRTLPIAASAAASALAHVIEDVGHAIVGGDRRAVAVAGERLLQTRHIFARIPRPTAAAHSQRRLLLRSVENVAERRRRRTPDDCKQIAIVAAVRSSQIGALPRVAALLHNFPQVVFADGARLLGGHNDLVQPCKCEQIKRQTADAASPLYVVVDLLQHIRLEIAAVVGAGEIFAEAFERHRRLIAANCRIVLIGVQHDDGISEREGGIWVAERLVVDLNAHQSGCFRRARDEPSNSL